MRRWLAVSVVPLVACAQLLSYDDYQTRDAAPADTFVAMDSAPVDVDAPSDSGPPPARVPARPAGPGMASGSGKTLWLAARSYSYGSSDPSGAENADAWASYGYDLDEVCTGERESTENTNTCLRPMGAAQGSLVDGERCRDNNFGRHLSLTFRSSIPDAEKTLNGLIRSGSTTWILRIDDVDTGADDAFAPGALFRSSDDRMMPPAWDGNDDRAVQSDSLIDGDLNKPVLSFPRGYVSGGVWVSGDPAPIKVIAPITAIGFFPLPLESAVVTLELGAAHGLLVGALPASQLQNVFDPIELQRLGDERNAVLPRTLGACEAADIKTTFGRSSRAARSRRISATSPSASCRSRTIAVGTPSARHFRTVATSDASRTRKPSSARKSLSDRRSTGSSSASSTTR